MASCKRLLIVAATLLEALSVALPQGTTVRRRSVLDLIRGEIRNLATTERLEVKAAVAELKRTLRAKMAERNDLLGKAN